MLNFLKALFMPPPPSGALAKERLRLVLLSDHLSLAPDVVEALKRDLLEVISRYVEIDSENADVTFEHREREVAMLASIPITGVRERRLASANGVENSATAGSDTAGAATAVEAPPATVPQSASEDSAPGDAPAHSAPALDSDALEGAPAEGERPDVPHAELSPAPHDDVLPGEIPPALQAASPKAESNMPTAQQRRRRRRKARLAAQQSAFPAQA